MVPRKESELPRRLYLTRPLEKQTLALFRNMLLAAFTTFAFLATPAIAAKTPKPPKPPKPTLVYHHNNGVADTRLYSNGRLVERYKGHTYIWQESPLGSGSYVIVRVR